MFSDKDGAVDECFGSIDILKEIDTLAVGIAEVERHLKLFCFVAATKQKHCSEDCKNEFFHDGVIMFLMFDNR